MAKIKVNASFAHTKQDELAPVASYIVDTVGKNANVFPNVPVPLTQVVAERDAFRDVVETLHATSLQEVKRLYRMDVLEYKFAVAAVGASAEVEWLIVGSTLSQRRFKSNKKMFELRSILGLDVKDFKGVYNTVFLNKESPAAELLRLRIRVDRLENDDIKWMKKVGFPFHRKQIITDYVAWGKDPFAQAVLYQINKIKLADLSTPHSSEFQTGRNVQHVGVIGEHREVRVQHDGFVGEKKEVDISDELRGEEEGSVSEVRYVNEVSESRAGKGDDEFLDWQEGEEKEKGEQEDVLDSGVSEVRHVHDDVGVEGYEEESGVSDVRAFDAGATGKKVKQDAKKRGEKKPSAKKKMK
ncbi:hypothetical protein CHS0354_000704 [Potamilus streckersoni]|uniref:Uncharacterized protein n=1 Tax=Potamilus streckersoni TaxID=2493646 RepID=A0AAE0W7J8_9BIVA|nr:hypothetical protein CHS0354_000704 [Potamilus streckersoni]